MEGFAEVRLKQAALDSIGLPQMSYPVPIHVLQGGLAEDGHLPLAAMLHGLQLQARPGGAPWRDLEPVMARLALLTSPDDNRAVISASSDAWWLELGPVDLTNRIVTIQRGDHLIAAVTPRDDGRLRVSTYRPLDAKSLDYLLGLGQAAHPVHGVNMRENNWEYALDCSAGNGNHYAAERGEAYLSRWDGGLGTWSDGSSEPEWVAQRTLSPRPAAQVLAEIAAHQEYSIFGETLMGPDRPSRESTSESFANQVSDRQLGQPLDLKARFAGCLLGGAVGDAMGAPVEFLRRSEILAQFGSQGITDYAPAYGSLGAITDDTQMALFTAEGLLRTWVRGATKGIADPSSIVANAYLRWLRTQGERPDRDLEVGADKPGWLFQHRALHSRRAPGSTCLSALRTMSRLGEPALNDSKGCGGVMRVAPVGLYAWHLRSRQTLEEVFVLGCALAALTHGHPTGSLAGGVLAVLVFRLVAGGHLIDAIGDAKGCLRRWPDHVETLRAIEQAETLSQSQSSPIDAIAALGEGWTAEEALAIGLYCALVAGSFKEGVILAVNHDGDSDSTGAIAASLVEALAGLGWQAEHRKFDGDLQKVLDDLRADPPGFVFNLVESFLATDRLAFVATGIYEAARVPFAGSGTFGLMAGTDKLIAKRLLTEAGIPTPHYAEGPHWAGLKDDRPYIVKAIAEHASLGLDNDAVVTGRAAVEARAGQWEAKFGGKTFAEEFITGREFNVAMIETPEGGRVLPLAEMDFTGFPEGKHRIIDYAAKWREDSDEYRHTNRRFIDEAAEPQLAAELRRGRVGDAAIVGVRRVVLGDVVEGHHAQRRHAREPARGHRDAQGPRAIEPASYAFTHRRPSYRGRARPAEGEGDFAQPAG